MKTTALIIGLFIIFQGCKKTDRSLPACINAKITQFKHTVPCKDAKVDEYLFQNKLVYVFDEGTCVRDGAALVYNQTCESIGYLGGFIGNTTIQGVDFSEEAVFKRTVWKN